MTDRFTLEDQQVLTEEEWAGPERHAWDEADHPRDDAGRFSDGGGGGAQKPAERPSELRRREHREKDQAARAAWNTARREHDRARKRAWAAAKKAEKAGGKAPAPQEPKPEESPKPAPSVVEQVQQDVRAYGESAISSSEVESAKAIHGKGVSELYKLKLKDGTEAGFKPDAGEPRDLRMGMKHGYMSARESGAWEVAKAVGMDDMVVPTIQRTVDRHLISKAFAPGEDTMRGSVILWVPGKTAGTLYENRDKYDGDEDLHRAAMFDYMVGNTDRHGGNWLVDNGKIRLIDHGLSFPSHSERQRDSNFIAEIRHRGKQTPIPKGLVERYDKAWPDIKRGLEKVGLPKESIDRMKFRIDRAKGKQTWDDLMHGRWDAKEEKG